MNLSLHPRLPGLLALLFVAAACSTEDGLGDVSADAGEPTHLHERHGALVADFTYPRSWDGDGLNVQAQFLDARGVAVESALQALEVWSPAPGLGLSDCVVTPLDRQPRASSEPVSLRLLDVGEIEIDAPEGHLYLAPRRLPDLLSAFYGVVYGSEWSSPFDGDLLEYYPGSTYRFSAPGSSLAGGFDVTLRAPEPMVLLAANGEELRGGYLDHDSQQDLELVWEIDGADDVEIFIDVSPGYGPDQPRLQCRTPDTGAFTVPASMLSDLRGHPLDLEIRRVRRVTTAVDGLDEAHFFFTTTDRVELR